MKNESKTIKPYKKIKYKCSLKISKEKNQRFKWENQTISETSFKTNLTSKDIMNLLCLIE